MSTHESRCVRGLPGALPTGEHILWQAKPCWRSVARHMCHVRGVAIYLGVVIAGTAAAAAAHGGTIEQVALTAAPLVAAGAFVLAFLVALAWMVARSTEYTLTTQRLVMRIGVALPAVLAIPHRGIAHAGVRMHRDMTGDLPIATKPGYEVTLRRVWPHARPWRLSRPEPMLRCVPNAGVVAALLARTLATAESERHAEHRAPVQPARPRVAQPAAAELLPTG